ncbi:MAG: TfoX/Sxy family protein [Thermodesulfobacteriota bacterium]
MPWKKVPQELADHLDSVMADFPSVRKTMFGCPAYFVNGNMFAAAHQENVILRLHEKDREALQRENDEAGPFGPMEGRVMKEYLAVPESLYSDMQEFRRWLARSYEYVKALPEKKKKAAKKR